MSTHNIEKKITLNYSKSAATVWRYVHGTQEQVRNSRGK